MSNDTTTAQHTPGPWEYKAGADIDGKPYAIVQGMNGTRQVADLKPALRDIGGPEVTAVDGNLIAAAPDLLNELRVLYELAEGGGTASYEQLVAAEAAITKAERIA